MMNGEMHKRTHLIFLLHCYFIGIFLLLSKKNLSQLCTRHFCEKIASPRDKTPLLRNIKFTDNSLICCPHAMRLLLFFAHLSLIAFNQVNKSSKHCQQGFIQKVLTSLFANYNRTFHNQSDNDLSLFAQ